MRSTLLLAVLASGSFLTHALSASVVGTLSEANCGGGGVTVTNTTITWLPATGGGTGGCIQAGAATNVTWSTGSLTGSTLGVTGNILNLPPNPPVAGFMTFTGMPGGPLSFDLTAILPPIVTAGLCNSVAANTTGSTCVATTTSPFVITNLGSGNVSVSLSVAGIIRDPGTPSEVSNWGGSFSTQLNLFPVELYNVFNGGAGTITSTQSGQFQITFSGTRGGGEVPEPGSMVLLGGGLVGLATLLRRRKSA